MASQIILRNEILGSNNVFKVTSTLNKVWLIVVLKGVPIEKSSISKTNVDCSNTKVFLLYYEPMNTRNPDIFKIHGIFRTLEYSKVRRDLHSSQTYCIVFRK